MPPRPIRDLSIRAWLQAARLGGRLIWWPPRRRRILTTTLTLAACAGIAAALAVFHVRLGHPERWCANHPAACGVATNVLSTSLVALAVAVVWFSLWKTRRAVRPYLRLVRSAPHLLLNDGARDPDPGQLELVDRAQEYESLSDDLRGSADVPQLIVGDSGAGKTTALIGFARFLAGKKAVPVVLSLRGQQAPFDLVQLAREAFVRAVDAYVGSSSDADKIWRSLRRRRDLVILADGLDELAVNDFASEVIDAATFALRAAARIGVPTVFTTRPTVAPPRLSTPVHHLRPLDIDKALAVLRARSGLPVSATQEDVLRRAEVTATPLYLRIATELQFAGLLRDISGDDRFALRIGLLDAYLEALAQGSLLPDVGLTTAQRISAIQAAEYLACGLLHADRLEMRLDRLQSEHLANLKDYEPNAISVLAGVENATLLGITIVRHAGELATVRFAHPLLMCHAASRVMNQRSSSGGSLWKKLVTDSQSRELLTALVMAAARRTSKQFASEVTSILVDRAESCDESAAAYYYAAALDVCNAAGVSSSDAEIARGLNRRWSGMSRPGKLRAIESVARSSDRTAQRSLWHYSRDGSDYSVRWTAVSALTSAGVRAYPAIAKIADIRLERAEQVRSAGAPPQFQLILDLGFLGWLLPPLVTELQRASSPNRGDADAQLSRLVGLLDYVTQSGVDGALGVESSLAQGFKIDALRHPDAEVDERAVGLLPGAQFWYSRLNLVHAVSRRARPDDELAIENVRQIVRRKSEHPLVRETARQCCAAISKQRQSAAIWDDESLVITESGRALGDRTAQLLADVVLLLNLSDQARRPLGEMLAVRRDLPACLCTTTDRSSLARSAGQTGSSCVSGCVYRLCPLSPRRSALSWQRGPFSPEFCQHQIHLASRLGAPTWHRTISPTALAAFWREMLSRTVV